MGRTKQREKIIQNETCWRTGKPRSYCHFVITDMFFDNSSRTTDTQKIFEKWWKGHECTHCPGFIAVWPWYTGQGRGIHSLTGPVVFFVSLSPTLTPTRQLVPFADETAFVFVYVFSSKTPNDWYAINPVDYQPPKGPWLNVRTKTCKVCRNYTTLMICFF